MRAVQTLALYKRPSAMPRPTRAAPKATQGTAKAKLFFANNAQFFFWRISDQGCFYMHYAGAANLMDAAVGNLRAGESKKSLHNSCQHS